MKIEKDRVWDGLKRPEEIFWGQKISWSKKMDKLLKKVFCCEGGDSGIVCGPSHPRDHVFVLCGKTERKRKGRM